MHLALERASDTSSRCRPHTAGGHSHNAPATTEVISGANRSAATTTSWPASRRHSAVVSPTTPAPITRILDTAPLQNSLLIFCRLYRSELGNPRLSTNTKMDRIIAHVR